MKFCKEIVEKDLLENSC